MSSVKSRALTAVRPAWALLGISLLGRALQKCNAVIEAHETGLNASEAALLTEDEAIEAAEAEAAIQATTADAATVGEVVPALLGGKAQAAGASPRILRLFAIAVRSRRAATYLRRPTQDQSRVRLTNLRMGSSRASLEADRT